MRQITPPRLFAFVLALLLACSMRLHAQSGVLPFTFTITTRYPSGSGLLDSTVYVDQGTGVMQAYSYHGTASFHYTKAGDYYDGWSLQFSGPYGGPVHPGTYTGAKSSAGLTTAEPKLSVLGWSEYAEGATGSFTVKKIVINADGALVSFWATFDEGNLANGAHRSGEIRYNVDSTETPANQPPAVYAGVRGRRVALADGIQLQGGVSDDDLPAPPAVVTTWSKVSGPGDVTFADAHALQTSAQFSAAGAYVLRLSADDGGVATPSYDDIYVTVVDPAQSATIHVEGDPDAPITYGETVDFTELDGPISVGRTGTGTVWVSFTKTPSYDFYSFEFGAPSGLPLIAGTYADAGPDPYDETGRPYMHAARGGSDYADHRNFTVKKIAFDANGAVTAFWVVFDEAYSGRTARGEIRFHADSTDPGANQRPGVFAGADAHLHLSEALSLSGLAADDGLTGVPLVTTWSVVDGPGAVKFGDVHALTTTASFSAAGIYRLKLAADDGALQAVDELRVLVVDPAVDTSLDFYSRADTGETVLQSHVTPEDGEFSVDGSAGDGSITIYFTGFTGARWSLQIAPAGGKPLGLGLYRNAVDDYLPNKPRLSLSGLPTIYRGSFEILKLVRAVDGSVTSLRMVFCDRDDTGIRGELKFNAGAPVPAPRVAPGVSAGLQALAAVGAPLPLSGIVEAQAPSPGAITTQWSLVSGPGTVSFANASTLNTKARFSKAGDYMLRLTAQQGGLSRSSLLTVAVTGPNDPTRVRLIRSFYDVLNFDRGDSTLSIQRNSYNSTSVIVNRHDDSHWYMIDFDVPEGKRLEVGDYVAPRVAPTSGKGAPSIDITGDGSGFEQFGRFTVKQIEYAAGGSITKCWITFSAHEKYGSDTFRGEVRFHADVGDDMPPLQAYAGTDQAVFNADPAMLHGAALRGGAPAQDPIAVAWFFSDGVTLDNRASLTPTAHFAGPGTYFLTVSVASFSELSSDTVIVVATRGAPSRRTFYDGTFQTANYDLLGSIELRFTGHDYYSAKLHLGGKTYALIGLAGPDDHVLPGTNMTVVVEYNEYDELQCTLQSEGTEYRAQLSAGAEGILGDFPKALAGTYTFYAGHYSVADPAQALGAAWGTLTVTPKGFAIAQWHLPDGRLATTSSRLNPDGETFVNYSSPDGKCVIAGVLGFSTNLPRKNIRGDLQWTRRGASLVTRGPLNFTVRMGVDGEDQFQVPPNLEPLRLTAYKVPSRLYFTGLGDTTLRVPVIVSGRATTPNGTADTQASAVFDDFGGFSGTVRDPATGQDIPFQGILNIGSGYGSGYFYQQGKSGEVEIAWVHPER